MEEKKQGKYVLEADVTVFDSMQHRWHVTRMTRAMANRQQCHPPRRLHPQVPHDLALPPSWCCQKAARGVQEKEIASGNMVWGIGHLISAIAECHTSSHIMILFIHLLCCLFNSSCIGFVSFQVCSSIYIYYRYVVVLSISLLVKFNMLNLQMHLFPLSGNFSA